MKYKLLKDFETPCFVIRAGVIKTESEWINDIPRLQKNDCSIKKDWFEKYKDWTQILSVTDNEGNYYVIIGKEDMGIYENTEKGKIQNGYFGFVENGIFYSSQKRKDKRCTINYAKEDNYVFNHKRIKDRIDDLKELENAFNAARKQSDEVIGRGEYHSGDCGDLHKNLFRDFNDYMVSLTSK